MVYDYVDLKIPMFARMFSKRLRAYKKHQYVLDGELMNQDIVLINTYDISTFENILAKSQDLKIHIISNNSFEKLTSNMTLEKIESMINAIIIDEHIIWYGEINVFKESIYDDSIMRIDDAVYAKEIIQAIKK